jgi:hypothetical protein
MIQGREGLPYGYMVSQVAWRKVKKERVEKQEKRRLYKRKKQAKIRENTNLQSL